MPSVVTFGDGSTITYTYAADGTKLRTVHQIGDTITTTDYCGNVIYENGTAKLLLTKEGYVTLSDKQYHYFLKDHQGNIRVVLAQDGTVEETNHYYPFGGIFASTGNVQPYKYNGKELDTKKGLNLYDYGARHYEAALGRFLTVDPEAEKYYEWSSYVYCKNNPINRIDPDGKTDYLLLPSGQIKQNGKTNSFPDRLFFGEKHIVINDSKLLKGLTKNMGGDYYRRQFYQETTNLQDAVSVFQFAADNTTKEWKLDIYEDSDGNQKAVVATDMHNASVSPTENYNDDHAQVNTLPKKVDIHSHPDAEGTKGGSKPDRKMASPGTKNAIYHRATKTLYEYDKDNVSINSIKINTKEDLYKYITQ